MGIDEEYVCFPGLKEAQEQPSSPEERLVNEHGVRPEIVEALSRYIGGVKSARVGYLALMEEGRIRGATPEEMAKILSQLELVTPTTYAFKSEF